MTPDPVEVEAIKQNASELLQMIDDFMLIVEPEFYETLEKLSQNPVRSDA
jgi:hypothetical protein